MERNELIKAIKTALKKRSGRSWSVTGGTGTAWGWVKIQSMPKDQVDGYMTDADRKLLADLLGLNKSVHNQGEMIPSQNDYYAEYLARAEGRVPAVYGSPNWD